MVLLDIWDRDSWRLTVELSAARAGVWAWHFISPRVRSSEVLDVSVPSKKLSLCLTVCRVTP